MSDSKPEPDLILSAARAESTLRQARRIVVKVGSSLVTDEGRGLDAQAIGSWCRQLAELAHGKQDGVRRQMLLVSSGAVAEGIKRLGWQRRPIQMDLLQAAAAVGQMGLVRMYETQLARHGLQSAQILLTHAEVSDRERYLNARATLLALLQHEVLPVINENDTITTDGIKVGDNDTLAALVANIVDADLLIILTDQRGLFSADPRKDPQARLIEVARATDAHLQKIAGGAGSSLGKGGMLTKVVAATRAARSGASTAIVCGREPDVLCKLAAGQNLGTLLLAPTHKIQARKQWIADHLQLQGKLIVDAGAVRSLREHGKSLLPVGVARVEGHFIRGDVVSICDETGHEVARGLVNYPASEAQRLCRHASVDIADLLGYSAEPELVHRDNLVLMS